VKLLIAGATGLVGAQTARQLAALGHEVTALVRRVPPSPAAGVHYRVADFDRLGDVPDTSPEAAICALGTTIRAAGSQAAFARVDLDYVRAFAALAKAQGARQFLLVSSVGASDRGNFYLRTKAAAERAAQALGFARVDVFRPGLLLGPRTEVRPGEQLGQWLAPLLNPLLLGGLAKYAGIRFETVASVIAASVGAPGDGVYIHHNTEMIALASRL
jgi:uncharacterized protein YbjT (DUF2867 family)